MLKIYLAEDQVMIAQALKTLLELEDDLKVIGTATDGKKALKDIIALKPDIALLDIEIISNSCESDHFNDICTRRILCTSY